MVSRCGLSGARAGREPTKGSGLGMNRQCYPVVFRQLQPVGLVAAQMLETNKPTVIGGHCPHLDTQKVPKIAHVLRVGEAHEWMCAQHE